jgi:hypothetical protein
MECGQLGGASEKQVGFHTTQDCCSFFPFFQPPQGMPWPASETSDHPQLSILLALHLALPLGLGCLCMGF